MSSLQYIDLSANNLSYLPYNAFKNVSHLHTLNVHSNSLTTIELWTIQVQTHVNYQFNKINRFSNYFNVDLSDLQFRNLPTIILSRDSEIYFDDTVYEMYNRCVEVNSRSNFSETYAPTLTLAILTIIGYTQPFYHNCTCDKYYFYRSAFAAEGHSDDNFFSNWICPSDSIPFIQKCNNQSSAKFIDVIPRLCKINDSEPGIVPVCANSSHCGLVVTTTPITFTTTTPSRLEILFNETLSQVDYHLKILLLF
jgi:Leucine-rich repeat (LRR) protein